MPAQDPAAVSARWSQALGAAASSGRISDGIKAVTVPPGQAAARQKNAWVQNVAAAASKWAANVAAVSLSDWQDAAVNKGVQRIASGATAAQPKFQAFMTQFLPFLNTAVSSLPPRGSFEQNTQRALAMMTATHKFSFKK